MSLLLSFSFFLFQFRHIFFWYVFLSSCFFSATAFRVSSSTAFRDTLKVLSWRIVFIFSYIFFITCSRQIDREIDKQIDTYIDSFCFFFSLFFAKAFRGTTPTAFRGTVKLLSCIDDSFDFVLVFFLFFYLYFFYFSFIFC